MVETSGIIRPQTSQERVDFHGLKEKTPTGLFRKKLAEVEFQFTKDRKPFDGQCARIDFMDKLESMERESERQFGYINVDMSKLKFDDLEKYGDMSRFELIEDDEEVADKIIDGMRTQVKAGHTLKYVCKQRGHGISVFLSNEIYEERFGKKKVVAKEDK